FVQTTTQLSPAWALLAGIRLSTVQLSSADHYLSDGNGSGSQTFRANTPVLGLSYRASDTLNFFANFGRGFESPTLNEVAYDGAGVPTFNTAVHASGSEQYEIGAKWAPTAQSRVDLTAFQVNAVNEIVVVSSTGGNSTYKNVPGTARSGVELAASALLTAHVRVSLSGSWIDAIYTQAFTSGTNSVASGNRIPGVPQNFLFSELLWSQQSLSGGSKKAATLGAQAGLELTQAGRLYSNDTNSASAPGYTALNAKLSYGWALGAARLSLFSRVDNLNNQHYVGSVIVNQSSSQFYESAPGANWTVGVRGVLPL
ncbi:MAG: TonB-dependent receptor, partial [Betaproteobacteria bacterium]